MKSDKLLINERMKDAEESAGKQVFTKTEY